MPSIGADADIQACWPVHWPFLIRKGNLPGPFHATSRPFWILYDEVTTAIRSHIAAEGWSLQQRVYMEYLMSAFFEEYRSWEHKLGTEEYLRIVDERSPSPIVALMAHAYFHMAYDLPRTLADCPRADRPIALSDELADELFLELNPIFPRVLKRMAKRYRVTGCFSIPSRALVGNRLAGVLANWIMVLRAGACVRARTLRKATGVARIKLEAKLLTEICVSVERTLPRRILLVDWLLLGIPKIRTIMLLLPFATVGGITSSGWVIATMLGGTTLLIILYTVFVYRGAITLADRLGHEIWQATGRVFRTDGPPSDFVGDRQGRRP